MDLFDLALYRALNKGGGEPGDITVESLSVTSNGRYDAPTGKAYSPVSVNVQPTLQSKTVTENGTVTPDEGYDGLSSVVVNVQGGGGGSVYMHSVTLTQYQFIAKALIVSSSGTPFTYDTLVQWLNNNGFNTSSNDGVYPIIGKDGSGNSNNLIGIYYNGNNLTAVRSGSGSNTNTFTVVDAVVPA